MSHHALHLPELCPGLGGTHKSGEGISERAQSLQRLAQTAEFGSLTRWVMENLVQQTGAGRPRLELCDKGIFVFRDWQ